jgi:putative transposase
MPRASRHYAPGYTWHITHRCHKREFLLGNSHDRDLWRRWLFEARKRFGLCVLNYMITRNHIHLLVIDTGDGVISKSMQLAAARVGQEYNARNNRSGAFWEDRYHATAVDSQGYLLQCMLYIDLNMVRTGLIRHPSEWEQCGFSEIMSSRQRYRIIDSNYLVASCGFQDKERFVAEYRMLIEKACASESFRLRDWRWSEAVAIGRRTFLEGVQAKLGTKVPGREISEEAGTFFLKEPGMAYGVDFGRENEVLRGENGHYLKLSH